MFDIIESIVAPVGPGHKFRGRRKIYTNKKEITDENILEVISSAIPVHQANASEIQYLYNYYCGVQAIQNKQSIARPEINNIVTVNLANHIVTFDTSFSLSGPIQYTSADGDDASSESVRKLNGYMRSQEKDSKDKELVDWVNICGVGVRIVLPSADDSEESPAEIYSLDPRFSFVIYYSGIGEKPLAGVIVQKDENNETVYCVYTKNRYYEIKQGKIDVIENRTVPYIPIVEYLNNVARLGSFEIVLPLLDAVNRLSSDRVDNVQDFVNAFDVFQNCELQKGEYGQLSKGGMAIEIKSTVPGMESKVYRIASELNQSGVQTAIDDIVADIFVICGIPNRNGGSSTSDTGTASFLRDGWASADSRASDSDKMFDKAEREFLKPFLYICRESGSFDLNTSDIKIEHSRNNLSNMQSRIQILCECLNNEKIHPKFAWTAAGVSNAEEWYNISREYYEEEQQKLEESLKEQMEMSQSIDNNPVSQSEETIVTENA